MQCLDLPSSSRPGSKLRSGSGLWTIDILLDAFNTPLETSDTLVTPSEEELQSSQSLRGLPRQESRCNKSKRSAEISTPAASVIQTREVKLHKLQADVSGLRAPEAVPAPSTSASYRMKTANPRSSSCSPCLTSGDHLAFFQADGQDLIDIPQRKDARGGRVDAVPVSVALEIQVNRVVACWRTIITVEGADEVTLHLLAVLPHHEIYRLLHGHRLRHRRASCCRLTLGHHPLLVRAAVSQSVPTGFCTHHLHAQSSARTSQRRRSRTSFSIFWDTAPTADRNFRSRSQVDGVCGGPYALITSSLGIF